MTASEPQRPEPLDLINRRLLGPKVRAVAGAPSAVPTRSRVLRVLHRALALRLEGDEVVGHLRTATGIGAFGRTSAPVHRPWRVDAGQVGRWVVETNVLVEGERLDPGDHSWLAEQLCAATRQAVADAPPVRDRTDLIVPVLVRRVLSGHVLRIDHKGDLVGHRQARKRWQLSGSAVQPRSMPTDKPIGVEYLREQGRLGLLQLGEGPIDDAVWMRVHAGLIAAVTGAEPTPQTT